VNTEVNRPLMPSEMTELVSAQDVQRGFDELAAQLQPLVAERDCVLLGIMNGGLYPLMQLMLRLQGDYRVDYCHASRYREGTQGGALHWLREPPDVVQGRTVLLIDDIFDEGCTLAAAADACRGRGATDVFTVVEVIKDKPARGNAVRPDYSAGITVPDVYVFGCGMDYAGRWRHLPSIYALHPEASR